MRSMPACQPKPARHHIFLVGRREYYGGIRKDASHEFGFFITTSLVPFEENLVTV